MRVVIDCNVMISAGLTNGTCRRVLQKAITECEIILSPSILLEYQGVAARPKFQRVSDYLELLILDIARVATFVYPGENASDYVLPDPKDVPYLIAAVEGEAQYLVTGNLRDFPVVACAGISVVSPDEFCRC